MLHASARSADRRPLWFAAFLALLIGLPACRPIGNRLDLSVTRYAGPPITQTTVRGIWSAVIDADEVVLLGDSIDPYASADRSLASIHLTFENQEGALPRLKDVRIGTTGDSAPASIKRATVEIQSWDLAGEISGTVRTVQRTGPTSADAFWLDLSQTAASQTPASRTPVSQTAASTRNPR